MFIASYLGACAASAAASCACCTGRFALHELSKRSARLTYALLFFTAILLSWVMRDFARPFLEKIPWIMRAAAGFHPSDVWFGQQAVYRVSLGTALFFLGMAALLRGVRYKGDRRGRGLQHKHWGAKVAAWAALVALTFFLPNGPIAAYGWVARLGSGLFLVVQVIILLDFAQSWNDAWASRGEEDPRFLYGLLALTALALAAAALVSLAALRFFDPSTDAEGLPLGRSCGLNVSLIASGALMSVGMCAVSVHPLARRGSLFPAALMSLYCCYLIFSALQSEPRGYACNALARRSDAASGSTVAVGVLVTLSSVVYSALRAGSNTNLFLIEDEGGQGGFGFSGSGFGGADADDGDDDGDSDGGGGGGYAPLSRGPARCGGVLTAGDVAGGRAVSAAGGEGGGDEFVPPASAAARASRVGDAGAGAGAGAGAAGDFAPVAYNYAFFHLVFALASMYIAMLMTGWGGPEGGGGAGPGGEGGQGQGDGRVGVGWASVGVKAGAAAAAALLYSWTLVAPALFPDREFY